MLVVPDNYRTYKLIAIDPGLSNTGVAIYELYGTSDIVSINAFTIKPKSNDTSIVYDEDIVGDRILRLESLKNNISNLIKYHNPSIVVHEGAFYSSFRPMAYGSLVETISYIKNGILSVTDNIIIDSLQPLFIKKIIGAGMNKGKIDVTKCVSSNEIIMSKLVTDINYLDEHAIDAIAIGYSYLKHSGVLL